MTVPNREEVQARLLAVIERGALAEVTEAEFEEIAGLVFAWQYAANPIYRGFCNARGVWPGSLSSWVGIPALPADAFKAAALFCGDPATATTIFRTSGTTRGTERRGEHLFRDTGLYEAALLAGFSAHLLPEGGRIRVLSIVASRGEVPDSSLSFMVSQVMETFGTEGSAFFLEEGTIQVTDFLDACASAEREALPVLVVGTSLGFLYLLDDMESHQLSVRLPAGSRAMDTGGFKGRMREVGRSELYGRIEASLGITSDWIVNEYGMTEMSSQLYDGTAGTAGSAAGRRYRAPGWVRTIAVDPETLQPLAEGSEGILRHVDLANLDSVMAIQTADLGRVTGEGVELTGRMIGAEPRGCSLAMEDLRGTLG
jgi:hypothetical protein